MAIKKEYTILSHYNEEGKNLDEVLTQYFKIYITNHLQQDKNVYE